MLESKKPMHFRRVYSKITKMISIKCIVDIGRNVVSRSTLCSTVNCKISKHLSRKFLFLCSINIAKWYLIRCYKLRHASQRSGLRSFLAFVNQKVILVLLPSNNLLQQHNYNCSTCLFITGIKNKHNHHRCESQNCGGTKK